MPVRPKSKALVSLEADGDRLDDARRKLLADWCRLVGKRVGSESAPADTSAAVTIDANTDHEPRAITSGITGAGTDGATRIDRTPGASIAALGLPKRMSQILMALLAGASEKQIAASLSISPHTVHTYVKQIHKRLDVSSRGELLAKFVQIDG